MTLSTIQVVALPQMTRRMSLRSDAHPFQNDSNAQRNPDFGVSYHYFMLDTHPNLSKNKSFG